MVRLKPDTTYDVRSRETIDEVHDAKVLSRRHDPVCRVGVAAHADASRGGTKAAGTEDRSTRPSASHPGRRAARGDGVRADAVVLRYRESGWRGGDGRRVQGVRRRGHHATVS